MPQDAVAQHTAVPKRGEKRQARDARIGVRRDAHNPSLSAKHMLRPAEAFLRSSHASVALRRLIAAALTTTALLHVPGASAAAAPDLPAIMRLTAESWIASQADGFLPYGFDFLADKAIEPNRMSDANLIRQTGSAFALAS